MNYFSDLSETIKSHPDIKKKENTGFYSIECPSCKSGKVKAGFVFNDDSIAYNCFRGSCVIGKTKYTNGDYIPRKFRDLMEKMNIEIPVNLLTVSRSSYTTSIDNDLYEPNRWNELELDNNLRLVTEFDTQYIAYLKSRKAVTEAYRGSQGMFRDTLVIPFKHNEKIIGWQGVNIKTGRYTKCSNMTGVLYLPVGKIPKNPYIVEGVFDALMFPNQMIACLDSTISKKQAYHLRYSNPIVVLEKNTNLLEVAKKYNWRVSVPDFKVKDVNEAVVKYGRLITARLIHDGLCDSMYEAEVRKRMLIDTRN